jgi:hypothetical protein
MVAKVSKTQSPQGVWSNPAPFYFRFFIWLKQMSKFVLLPHRLVLALSPIPV